MFVHMVVVDEIPLIGSRVKTSCGEWIAFSRVTIDRANTDPCPECMKASGDKKQKKLQRMQGLGPVWAIDYGYVCRICDGEMVEVGRQSDGRRVFNCRVCRANECVECAVCGRPRAFWADSGTVCIVCTLETIAGQRELTAEQHRRIAEWKITIRSSD